MYTPRVGENSKYDSPLLSPRDRPAPLCLLSSTEGNEFNAAFKKKEKKKNWAVLTDFATRLNLNTLGEI